MCTCSRRLGAAPSCPGALAVGMRVRAGLVAHKPLSMLLMSELDGAHAQQCARVCACECVCVCVRVCEHVCVHVSA